MKKILFTILIVAAISMNSNAQYSFFGGSDGFFTNNETEYLYRDINDVMPLIPQTGYYADQNAFEEVPTGSGLLILGGLGVAYALKKKRKEKKREEKRRKMKSVIVFLITILYSAALNVTNAQGTDGFFGKSYENLYRAAPEGPGGAMVTEMSLYGNASNQNLDNVTVVAIGNGLAILAILGLVYLFFVKVKKRKLTLLLLIAPMLFTQCQPDNNEDEDEDDEKNGIYVSGRIIANSSRTSIINQNGTGIISWEQNDKIFCYPISTQNTFTEFNNSNGSDVFECKSAIMSNAGNYLRFYKIGYSDIDIISSISTPSGQIIPQQTDINISISTQSGKIEDFGQYHISKSNDVLIKKLDTRPPTFTFEDATFTSMIAYACFDLSKYEGKEVKISVDNANNHFCLKGASSDALDDMDPEEIFSQAEGTDGTITITNPSSETYVAMLPSSSSVVKLIVDDERVVV